MHHKLLTPLAAGLLIASAPAQLSGSYLIDPNGGTGVFHSFTEAVNALFVNGVSGSVEILVTPGTYTESVLVPPIQGSSTTNRITFRALAGPGTVLLGGAAGDTFALLGVAFLPNSGFGWHDITFTGAPGHAISASTFVEGLDIGHCTFLDGHRSTAPGEFRHAVLVSENSGQEAGWHIHHCHFTLATHTNRQSYGVYQSNGGDWEFHDNVMDMNGADYGLWMINNNRRVDRVANNLFVGSLYAASGNYANNACVIRADISNFENEFVHNTFAITVPSSGCCIATAGYGTGSQVTQNYVRGNVFSIAGPGTAICLTSYSSGLPPFVSEGNVFHCPNGEIGRVAPGTPGETTLAGWIAVTGQDTASVQADPLLTSPFSLPYDLRPQPGSPVIGVAPVTSVTTDHAGRLRDAAPDAGAFELTSFAIYGRACPGTGGTAPAMGSTGTVALGSTNFAMTLAAAPASTVAVLFGGLSRTFSSGQPLPYDLGGGCAVYAAPDAVITNFTSPTGTANLPFVIPNAPGLIGTDLFFQWAVIDAGSGSAYGITVTEAGALQL
jgi:hypothetical protein